MYSHFFRPYNLGLNIHDSLDIVAAADDKLLETEVQRLLNLVLSGHDPLEVHRILGESRCQTVSHS